MRMKSLTDVLQESPRMQRLYAQVMMRRSDRRAAQGRILERAVQLMRGVRAVGMAGSGAGGRRRVQALLDECCRADGQLRPIADNELLAAYQQSAGAERERASFAACDVADRVRMRYPRDDGDPDRQGDLMLLKRYSAERGEKGVLLISYTEAIWRFAALFDVAELSKRYSFVVEPSWWGYEDPAFLFLVGADADVIVQSSWRRDYEFISALDTNLVPIALGAGQWLDPATFGSGPADRTYDVVMVSSWSPFKRHAELFEMLARVRDREGRTLKAALIGYPAAWTRAHIEDLIRKYGVQECCTIFESVPHAEVARVVGDSRVYVLLSRREGSNRGLYEAMFCNTPVVVYAGHRGVNTSHVNEQTGALYQAGALRDAVLHVLDKANAFEPRRWALANAGFENATRFLNTALRSLATSRRQPWSTDIVRKVNAPNPRYADPEQCREFDAEYESLAAFLLPVSTRAAVTVSR
jgi:hypothetical protein